MMRVLRSSLLISLLVVEVKDPSLNEAMAKIKKSAGGFEPKEPPEHKMDTKVGLHLDHLLAVSAPLSALYPHAQHYSPLKHPQHTPQHPRTPSAPSAPSAPFSSCAMCWHFEPFANAPLQ